MGSLHVTYSAEPIPGTNAWVGKVWINGAEWECGHKHSGFTSAKGCADLRARVERMGAQS